MVNYVVAIVALALLTPASIIRAFYRSVEWDDATGSERVISMYSCAIAWAMVVLNLIALIGVGCGIYYS